jgi:hypothetical protein
MLGTGHNGFKVAVGGRQILPTQMSDFIHLVDPRGSSGSAVS